MYSSKCLTGVSLSNDLDRPSEMAPIKLLEARGELSLLDSNSEFEFCISSSSEHGSSSADELFFNGVILPSQNRERFVHSKRFHQCEKVQLFSSSLPPLPATPKTENSRKGNSKEVVVIDSESEKKNRSKSLWGFKRSNCVASYDCRKSSFCSLPLLSRSNSTGSSPTPKRMPLKDVKTQNSVLQRQRSVSEGNSKSLFPSSLFSNSYSKLRKPHSKKNQGGIYGSNLHINPILNVPPPYMTKETANISGLSSLLRSGKEKKSRQ